MRQPSLWVSPRKFLRPLCDEFPLPRLKLDSRLMLPPGAVLGK